MPCWKVFFCEDWLYSLSFTLEFGEEYHWSFGSKENDHNWIWYAKNWRQPGADENVKINLGGRPARCTCFHGPASSYRLASQIILEVVIIHLHPSFNRLAKLFYFDLLFRPDNHEKLTVTIAKAELSASFFATSWNKNLKNR